MMTWEDHKAEWEAMRESAIAEKRCFCACGCVDPATYIPDYLGLALPGLCGRCHRGNKSHGIMRNAAETYRDPSEEQPVRRVRRFIARFVPDFRRAEATAYVREYGEQGLSVVSDLYPKVMAGERLTDAQVEAVLRSKAAEERTSKAALKRLVKEEATVAKALDLNFIFIGDEVEDGTYAVESEKGGFVMLRVDRPKSGTLRGFVTVNHVVGEGVERWGVQYPQPHAWTNPNHRQFYRGNMAHLVAQLVADPAGARALAERLEVS